MKKFLYIPMVLGISILFVACGAKTPVNASKPTTTTPITNTKIIYTQKLTYLPSYNGIQPTEYTAASKKAALAISKCTIKNTTDTKVFQDYENILKKDGWTITEAKKYSSIFAKKDKHIANIIVQKSGKDVILQVMSK
ncbi:hypothetical protein LGL55_11645 [Clostridium tagluense]|uniref:hypothetical protein n=1 Tax=Clostridium tagluense TaxID=360422 RepID=UPI001C0AAF9D|nr:hypothetical protein [Clostridium tagluense]MBU3127180.1 hypothetical protein [Clostridium tagluense]MCB2312044.1 hypothetical protein [Clostridium tagluense]MCB2316631.1 hypothetical protein [Clostridium tagluense]MCB2321433.1 hypothetical protein [Clostridium tagluense]MCB2326445.1 hypothetical protein [Clostridium tagluense]